MPKKRFTLKTICVMALLAALEIVLNRLCSINTQAVKIGFSFLPISLCAMLYGPLAAGITYGLSDFLGAVLFPIGPYHVGFTLGAVMMGLVYGLFLYRDPESRVPLIRNRKQIHMFTEIVPAALINCVLIGLFINTCFVAQLYGSKTYWGWFMYRLLQYLVLVPLHIVFLPVLTKLGDQLKRLGLAAR